MSFFKSLYGHIKNYHRIKLALICGLCMAWTLSNESFASTVWQTFDSPQAGVNALLTAIKENKESTLRSMFGAEGSKLLSSGDEITDEKSREAFIKSYNEANKIVLEGDDKAILVIGRDEWPMPIPLVKFADGWRFDSEKGKEEILKRRIGRNELETMQVCLAIVNAEKEYAARNLDSSGVPVYASKFRSTPGKHDGLYWPTLANERPSPLGALLAAAADEGYAHSDMLKLEPFHGYFFRILIEQGENAPTGARNYLVKGKMNGGFAIFAFPAQYGITGVTSFLVDHDGVIYEKDMGQNTKSDADAIMSFNPGPGWEKSDPTK